MSSILVKEMSMPTECEYCGFCRYYQENGRVWCNAKNRVLLTHWEKPDWTHLDIRKPDWCPLVEVKTPHGRLFDETEVKKCLQELTDCEDKWSAIALLEWAIEKRWCIEAEGE